MPVSVINRVKTIVKKLQVPGNSDIIPVYVNTDLNVGDEFLPGYRIISWNCFVKNLLAYAKITSLAEIRLPDFKLEDSDTDKLYKALDIEWKSARKQLNLHIGERDNNTWYPVGSTSLLNPSGYPYRVYKLIDLYTQNLAIELGGNGKIGVQVQDVGYGLLVGDDQITIHGSCVEEIIVEHEDPQPITNVYIQGGFSSNAIEIDVLGNSGLVSNDSFLGN